MAKKVDWTNEMKEVLVHLYNHHTYKEISEIINEEFDVKTTPNMVRKAYERYKMPVLNNPMKNGDDAPKILLLDIETMPIMANVWSIWQQNVGLNMIERDWSVLSWAAKWYHDSPEEIMYMDQRNAKDINDDKKILKEIWKLLDEADIVVGQNSKAFDIKKLNARFIMHGMKPPSSFRQIDTKIIAKRHFAFTSNKLEYMTDKLCTKYKKLKHGKFPGFSMWAECMKGNIEAWEEMEEYNKYDVLSLEELYEILLPWDDSINFTMYFEDDVCSCGNTEFKKNGFYYTNASKFQKYKCKNCGTEFRGKKNLRKGKQFRKNRR